MNFRTILIRSVHITFSILLVTNLTTCVVAQDIRDDADLIKLLRDETARAPQNLKWRGPQLEDETRFAVAASGLTWNPTLGNTTLLVSDKKGVRYTDSATRIKGFQSAKSADAAREKFAFALSIVLTPIESGESATHEAMTFLHSHSEAYDRALLGILQAPEKLPLLSEYLYSAADLLVHRAGMKLFPVFLTLADSRDSYLKSRGIAALGVLAYSTTSGKPEDYVIDVNLRENGMSAVQRKLISQVLDKAAEDRSYRVRAATAYANGLIGNSDALVELEKLAKDRAYVVVDVPDKQTKTVVFPVRHEAAMALRRLGRSFTEESGTYRGKELNRVLKGMKDTTVDTSEMRKGLPFGIPINVNRW